MVKFQVHKSNTPWDMNYFLPFWSSRIIFSLFGQVQTTDYRQTTDRKRCIWAHRASCTGGLKNGSRKIENQKIKWPWPYVVYLLHQERDYHRWVVLSGLFFQRPPDHRQQLCSIYPCWCDGQLLCKYILPNIIKRETERIIIYLWYTKEQLGFAIGDYLSRPH